jgi:hypothetical protein
MKGGYEWELKWGKVSGVKEWVALMRRFSSVDVF